MKAENEKQTETPVTAELLLIAGFKRQQAGAGSDFRASFSLTKKIESYFYYQVKDKGLVQLYVNQNDRDGVDRVTVMELPAEVTVSEMVFYKPITMEMLSGICLAYLGQSLVWDLVEIWRGQLEEIGFKVTGNPRDGRMYKPGKTGNCMFHLKEQEHARFVYEIKSFITHQEHCQIAGINTPADVRKFLEAVHELE